MTPVAFGRYRVIADIPGGNMGRIYLAEDPEIERRVVVKALGGEFDEEQRARFVREARAAGRLSHRHVVSVFDVGEQDRTPYIVMEYVRGETLAAIIRRQQSLSIRRRLDLFEQLCVGLDYAHNQGVVHRDIKPSNLMVDGSGTLRILDFGIARIEGDKTSTAILGTMNYMSPEQWSGEAIDRRTDIFSVGAVAYELFSGRRAFPGASAPEVLRAVTADGPAPLEAVSPMAPVGLGDVIRRMLARAPDDRFDSLNSALPAVHRIRTELGPADDRDDALPPEWVPTRAYESFPVTQAPSSAETRSATHSSKKEARPIDRPVAKPRAFARSTMVIAGIAILAMIAVAIALVVSSGNQTQQTASASVPPAAESTPAVTQAQSPTPTATSSPATPDSTPAAARGAAPGRANTKPPATSPRATPPPECAQLLEKISVGEPLTELQKAFLKKNCGG